MFMWALAEFLILSSDTFNSIRTRWSNKFKGEKSASTVCYFDFTNRNVEAFIIHK